jgi:hypothetical protein
MNSQKYLTALLYASMTPISVWAGFELGKGDYLFGVALTLVLMVMEAVAVVTWMNAQTTEIRVAAHRMRKPRGSK